MLWARQGRCLVRPTLQRHSVSHSEGGWFCGSVVLLFLAIVLSPEMGTSGLMIAPRWRSGRIIEQSHFIKIKNFLYVFNFPCSSITVFQYCLFYGLLKA